MKLDKHKKAELLNFLLENKQLHQLGKAQLVDYVGVDKNGDMCWIAYRPAKEQP